MSEKQGWGNICERVDTCALTGAGAFFAAIEKSEVLINGPLWCYFYALRHLEKARPDMYTRFYGSQPDNNAVIYGSEEYVTQELQRMLEDGHKPSVLLLESSCSLSLIGDDLAGMARKLQLPFPVVTLDSGGMVGGFAEGYAKAGKKLFAQLLPQTATAKPLAVNILGQSEFYLQGAADTRELKRLLQLAGYEVLCTPGCECTLEELQRLPEAALNIVTNAELGLPLAEYLQKKYGTPYVFAGLPYGVQGTLQMLFDRQYILTEDVVVETRYRTETDTWTDEDGNSHTDTYQVPYDYYICTVTLENFDLSHVPVYVMGEDQLSRYAIYMATLGNRPDLFPDSPYVNKYITGKPGDYEVPGEYLDDETFAAMLAEAQKYIGYPYVWGGSSPATSFDCSGYVSWVINHSGWNVGRLGAQGLYNICTPTSSPKPGDLVFFKGTYDTPGVSHCGIYVGDGKMLHCGDPIGYANLNTSYWQSHFYAYGRLP